LQAGEAGGDETFSPACDGMSIAVEFGGDVLVGGSVDWGSAEDEAAAEGECLGSGAGLNERLELLAVLVGEYHG
jgi:hypothetical protein